MYRVRFVFNPARPQLNVSHLRVMVGSEVEQLSQLSFVVSVHGCCCRCRWRVPNLVPILVVVVVFDRLIVSVDQASVAQERGIIDCILRVANDPSCIKSNSLVIGVKV